MDVQLNFEGDAKGAESAAAAIEAVLESIKTMAESVNRALGDITIGSGTVARIAAEGEAIKAVLASIEDRAHDTSRALSMQSMAALGGPALTMLASAQRGIPFVGYPGDARGTPNRITGVSSYATSDAGQATAWMRTQQQAVADRQAAAWIATQHSARDLDRSAAMLDAAAAALGGSGGGGGGGSEAPLGLLAALGMGHRGGRSRLSRMPGWAGYFGGLFGGLPTARFATPLALAGLGAERVIGSTLGIGGSMLGGVLGGGLYAGGLLGTAAVGMGTDMAGIGQAAGDIKNVTAAQNSLSQAIAVYGKNSREAQVAQAQLNSALAGFSPVARQAVINAANAGQHFKTLFDYFTGPAEKTGAQIITSGIRTGQAFLPTIGRYATGNLSIIQRSLTSQGGLFDWLKTGQSGGQLGGLGIFTQLEQMFQQRLPTGIHTTTQAIEVFLHAVLDAAQQTGGFLTGIDKFFTRLNTPTGLAAMNQQITNLIGLFRSWSHLLTSTVGLVFDLFKPAVGLGQDFANQMTRLVNLTRRWIEQPGTSDVLHGIFQAHQQQMDAVFQVLRALGPILSHTISAFLQIEQVIVKLTIGPLKALSDLITGITKIPFASKIAGWGIALGLVYKVGMVDMLTWFPKAIAGWIGFGGAATTAAATTDTALGSVDAAAVTTTGAVGALRLELASLFSAGMIGGLSGLAGLLGGILASVGGIGAGLGGMRTMTDKGMPGSPGTFGPSGEYGPVPAKDKIFVESDWKELAPGIYKTAGGKYVVWDVKTGQFVTVSKDEAEKLAKQSKGGGTNHPGGDAARAAATNAAHGIGVKGVVGQALRLGVGSGAVYGQTSSWSPDRKVDCSDYVYEVFTRAGFKSFPGTSETQWSQDVGPNWTSSHVANGDEKPGDVVFMVGSPEYQSPGHVGIVTAGSGMNAQVMQYYQTGKQADTIPLSRIGDLVGIKRFSLVGKSSGTAGAPYNPGAAGLAVGSTSVPGTGASGASTAPTRTTVLAQGHGVLGSISTALGSLGQLPHDWARRFTPELDKWKVQVQHLDQELRDKSLSQKTVDTIRARLDILTKDVQAATRKIATAIAAFKDLTSGKTLLSQIGTAMHGNLAELGINTGLSTIDPMHVNTLATVRAQLDPKLERQKAQLEKMDKELRDKTISQATVDTITRRMAKIQQSVTSELTKIKNAAQTQLSAATSAWSAFTSAFDSAFSATTGGGTPDLTALQTQLGQDALAVSLDQAQSAVLGGSTDPNLASQIVANITAALGVATTSTGIPYTQQQLDNWLQLWGVYYASLGYTPLQMYDAFNKLLASVGLPPIDNPYSTGTLPLPPGVTGSGTAGNPDVTGQGSPARTALGLANISNTQGYVPAGHAKAHHHVHVHHHTAASTSTHPAHARNAAGAEHKNKHLIEVKFEGGKELDKYITVTVDGEIQKQGKKANHRARSGRY